MKKCAFFITKFKTILNSIYTHLVTGNYSASGNWNSGAGPVPNGLAAIMTVSSINTSAVINLDISPTINQMNFTTANAWSFTPVSTNFLTIDGVTPSINASSVTNPTNTVPITFNADTTINLSGTGGPLNFQGAITASSRNITVNNTNSTTSTVKFSAASPSWTGGTLTLTGGQLFPGVATAFGGASGPTIVMNNSGTFAPNLNVNSGGVVANAISISDTGSNNFILTTTSGISGAISGNCTHDLQINGGALNSNCSALTLSGSGRLVFYGTNTISTNFNSTLPIYIGGSVAAACNVKFASTGTISNTINVAPGTAAAFVLQFDAGSGATVTGNIVLNSESNAFAGSIFRVGALGNAYTFNNVISNGASGAANITLDVQGAVITFAGTNTYTSPTTVGDFGTLILTGSLQSNVTLNGTIAANPGILKGTGTINGNVSVAGTAQVLSSSKTAVTDTLTINGNLTMNSTAKFHPRAAGGAATSKLQVNGNVTFGSNATNIVVFDGTVPTSGTYTIINFTGTRSGTLTAPVSPAGSTITYDDTAGAGKVILTVP